MKKKEQNHYRFGADCGRSRRFVVKLLFSPAKKTTLVTNFDVHRYLGTWFEIARFDHCFEWNINNAIAQYRLNENGNVKVRNSGYNTRKKNGRLLRGWLNLAVIKILLL